GDADRDVDAHADRRDRAGDDRGGLGHAGDGAHAELAADAAKVAARVHEAAAGVAQGLELGADEEDVAPAGLEGVADAVELLAVDAGVALDEDVHAAGLTAGLRVEARVAAGLALGRDAGGADLAGA